MNKILKSNTFIVLWIIFSLALSIYIGIKLPTIVGAATLFCVMISLILEK